MNLKNAYNSFFFKSDEGREFMAVIGKMKEQAYAELENNPERALYYAGKAKALSDLENHVKVSTLQNKS